MEYNTLKLGMYTCKIDVNQMFVEYNHGDIVFLFFYLLIFFCVLFLSLVEPAWLIR